MPPNIKHDHVKTSKEETEFLWWHFNFRTAYNIDVLSFVKLPYKVHMENSSEFEQKFLTIWKPYRMKRRSTDMIYKNAKALEFWHVSLTAF